MAAVSGNFPASGRTHITTYPELLRKAGISWQVYTNHEVGDGGGADGLGR